MTLSETMLTNAAMLLSAALLTYLVAGHVWHRVLAPLPAPDPLTFPRAGDRFGSVVEGVQQEVLQVADGMVYGTAVLEPGAAGPPMHTHDGFSETFVVREGTLAIELVDRIVHLSAGERFTVLPGVAHRPFNPTSKRVLLGSDDGPIFPQSFAASLVQLYRLMDTRGTRAITMLLQMSVIDPIADTHLAAMPRALEPVLRFVLGPTARLLGYRNYYPEWALHHG
jgi:quercetin dioxygenase-like cupin family protein